MTKPVKVGLIVVGMAASAVAMYFVLPHVPGESRRLPFTPSESMWVLAFLTCAISFIVSTFTLTKMLNPVTTSAVVRERIGRIQNTVAKVQVAIESEATAIDRAMNELKTVLEQHERELESVTADVARQKEEAERYKELASLTKAQQDAFLKTLSKNQSGSYLKGFFQGVASSLTAAVLVWLLTRIPR